MRILYTVDNSFNLHGSSHRFCFLILLLLLCVIALHTNFRVLGAMSYLNYSGGYFLLLGTRNPFHPHLCNQVQSSFDVHFSVFDETNLAEGILVQHSNIFDMMITSTLLNQYCVQATNSQYSRETIRSTVRARGCRKKERELLVIRQTDRQKEKNHV